MNCNYLQSDFNCNCNWPVSTVCCGPMTPPPVRSSAVVLNMQGSKRSALCWLKTTSCKTRYCFKLINMLRRLRFSSDADNVRLTNVCIIIIIIINAAQLSPRVDGSLHCRACRGVVLSLAARCNCNWLQPLANAVVEKTERAGTLHHDTGPSSRTARASTNPRDGAITCRLNGGGCGSHERLLVSKSRAG